MGRIIHFDMEALDPERAITFYRDVFDWELPFGMDPWNIG